MKVATMVATWEVAKVAAWWLHGSRLAAVW